jgi:hypothetical protein
MRRHRYAFAAAAIVALQAMTQAVLGVELAHRLTRLLEREDRAPTQAPGPTAPSPALPVSPSDSNPPTAPARNGPVSVYDCDYEAGYDVERRKKFRASMLGNTETHEIEVYETRDDHSFNYHPTGTAEVKVTRTGHPLTLVLESYEPTHWRIRAASKVRIERVLLYGYYPHSASGVPQSKIERGGAEFDHRTSTTAINSSTYCYHASKFSIGR